MRHTAIKCLLALVFGAALTLSFAPANAWWFAPWCLGGLFLLLDGASGRQGLLTGFCFGLGWFGSGLWWVGAGLARYTQAGLPLSLALTAGLCIYLSLFPAVTAALTCALARWRPARMAGGGGVLVFAAVLTLAEWARARLFGGMPLLAPGYAHAAGPLGGFAPLVGTLGLTFLSAAAAAGLARCLASLSSAGERRRWRLFPLVLAGLCLCGVSLDAIDFTRATGATLQVRLLQGNLPQAEKFTVAGLRRSVDTYISLIRSGNADLTVLPETALPIEWESSPPGLVAAWRRLASEGRTTLLMGAIAAAPARPGVRGEGTNSALALLPDSQHDGYDYRYDKVDLVPMSEQVPAGLEWLWHRVQADYGSLQQGAPGQAPLQLAQGRVAVGICYESMFDTIVARRAQQANLLVNISNYAWFRGSYAGAQHLQAAQLRARETGRWFIQAANDGMTALIDDKGRIRDVLPPDVTAALDGTVHMREGSTPFMIAGNLPLLLLCLLIVAAGARPVWRPTPQRAAAPAGARGT